jgi:hypothetical protein
MSGDNQAQPIDHNNPPMSANPYYDPFPEPSGYAMKWDGAALVHGTTPVKETNTKDKQQVKPKNG